MTATFDTSYRAKPACPWHPGRVPGKPCQTQRRLFHLETLVRAHEHRPFSLSLTLIFVVPGHIAPESPHPDLDDHDFPYFKFIPSNTSTPLALAARKGKALPDPAEAVLGVKRSVGSGSSSVSTQRCRGVVGERSSCAVSSRKAATTNLKLPV